MNKLGFVYEVCCWIFWELSEKNITDLSFVTFSLFLPQQYELFLEWLVSDDEKWIMHNNVVRKIVKAIHVPPLLRSIYSENLMVFSRSYLLRTVANRLNYCYRPKLLPTPLAGLKILWSSSSTVQWWKKLWDHMWNWKLLTLLKKDILNSIFNSKT